MVPWLLTDEQKERQLQILSALFKRSGVTWSWYFFSAHHSRFKAPSRRKCFLFPKSSVRISHIFLYSFFSFLAISSTYNNRAESILVRKLSKFTYSILFLFLDAQFLCVLLARSVPLKNAGFLHSILPISYFNWTEVPLGL